MGKFNDIHLIRRIDLFSLRLFLSVVEEGQIGRAAIRENIAPSTATKRIQDLEEIAGIGLLDRTAKGVVASAAGEVVARYARNIIDNIEGLRVEMSGFNDGGQGVLAIASMRSITEPFLTPHLSSFAQENPAVELIVNEVENGEIVPLVVRGDADIGIFVLEANLSLDGVDVMPYMNDRFVAVAPPGHPIGRLPEISFAQLLTENFIAIKGLMGIFQNAAKRADTRFEARFNVKSPDLALSLVRDGLGVTVLPEGLIEAERGSFAIVSLAEPWAKRKLEIATARGRALSPVAQRFIARLMAQQ